MQWSIGNVLGKGSISTVWLAEHLHTGMLAVIKVTKKQKLKARATLSKHYQEVEISKTIAKINSPHLLMLVDDFENSKAYFMVNELMSEGDLNKYIQKHDLELMTEEHAREIVRQVALGLKALHDNKIIHRDMKLSNIMVHKREDDSFLFKIGDFGCSAQLEPPDYLDSRKTGTFGYFAPEVFYRGEHSFGIDVWGLGVILWVMLSRQLPFYDSDSDEHVKKVCTQKLSFDLNARTQQFSPLLKNLLSKMFEKNPRKRCSIDEVLAHPWLEL